MIRHNIILTYTFQLGDRSYNDESNTIRQCVYRRRRNHIKLCIWFSNLLYYKSVLSIISKRTLGNLMFR